MGLSPEEQCLPHCPSGCAVHRQATSSLRARGAHSVSIQPQVVSVRQELAAAAGASPQQHCRRTEEMQQWSS